MNNKLVVGLSLAVAFLLGCVVTQATAPTPPPAWAGAPGDLKKWDYHCMTGGRGLVATMRERGREGWELVTGAAAGASGPQGENWREVWCFKRPLN